MKRQQEQQPEQRPEQECQLPTAEGARIAAGTAALNRPTTWSAKAPLSPLFTAEMTPAAWESMVRVRRDTRQECEEVVGTHGADGTRLGAVRQHLFDGVRELYSVAF